MTRISLSGLGTISSDNGLSLVGRPAIIRTNLGLQIKRLRKTLAEAQENYWWNLCFYILPLPYILYLRDFSFIQYYTI